MGYSLKVPAPGNIVVIPDEVSNEVGGFIIASDIKEKSKTGEVIGVSEDLANQVSVGEYVMFNHGGGIETILDGRKVLVLRAGEVRLYLTKNAEDN